MMNKSVQNCRFVHHAKFHCIMTTLNRLFKIEFERGGGLEKSRQSKDSGRGLNRPSRKVVTDLKRLSDIIREIYCDLMLKTGKTKTLKKKKFLSRDLEAASVSFTERDQRRLSTALKHF